MIEPLRSFPNLDGLVLGSPPQQGQVLGLSPEKSAAQTHVEELASRLSDYVSRLYGENAEFREADIPDPISAGWP